MKTILLVSFWLALVGGVLRLLAMGLVEYPRVKTISRFEESIDVMLAAAWCAWIAWTIW